MKILIKNFAAIHEFEFDLTKDLHVIYGENSIGKSYIAYVVYLVLKNLQELYTPNESRKEVYKKMLIKFMEENADKNEIDITGVLNNIFHKVLQNAFVKNLENSLRNTFGSIESLRNEYNKAEFEIHIENKVILRGQENNLIISRLNFDTPYFLKVKKSKKNTSYSFYRAIVRTFFVTSSQIKKYPLLCHCKTKGILL